MSSVRIWQLAQESGLHASEVLRRLHALGVDASSHASTVSAMQAERFRALVNAERNGGTGKTRVWELADRLGMDSVAVEKLLDDVGVHVTSHASTVWEFDVDRLLTALRTTQAGTLSDDLSDAPSRPREEITERAPAEGGETSPQLIEVPAGRSDDETEPAPPTVGQSEADRGDGDDTPLLRRIAGEVRPFWVGITGMVLLDLVAIPLSLLNPVPLKIAVDSVINSDPIPTFLAPIIPDALERTDLRLLLAVVVFQVLLVIVSQLQGIISHVLHTQTGEKLTVSFRSKLFRHAQRLSLAHHYAKGPTDALYRVQYDAQTVQHLLDSAVPFVKSVVLLGAILVVTTRISVQLAVVALVVAPPLFVLARIYATRIRGRYRRLREKRSAAMEVLQETLSAVEVVKAFGREEDERQRFVDRSDESVHARIRLAFAEGGFGLLINATTALGTAAVLYLGVRSVLGGTLKLGELLVVMNYLNQLYQPLKSISQKLGDAQNSLAGAERAYELLDRDTEVEERPDARPLAQAEGRLAFDHVWFSYGGSDHVLEDVSFVIRPGAKVGLVGRTGAGKTTLASLMMRFYDPTAGSILLDDTDVRDYDLADLRNQFALVLQKPVLFSNSVAENIRYARPGADFEDVVAAAEAADAHEFITALPDAYDTIVGDQGMRLSGGERQRVSLARAFLRDAPILLLDEPTSSVDRDTEATIMAALKRLMEGRTTIMIAHRLSTLDYCDALLELHDGRVRMLSDRDEVASSKIPA